MIKALTVSQLNLAIKSLIEPQFRGISVQGEISNFKAQTSGHLYFSLKDANSQIGAVLFKGNAASLPRLPKEGDQVIALGEISLYQPRGQYQIVIRELQFLGVGELLLKFHQLKEMLAQRGWFDSVKKKPLPKLPQTIGVVTSPTGAVIQDILNVLKRRFGNVSVLLNPVKVQGEGAAEEIAKAIEFFNQHALADVLIVGRGGGSIEDLWAFNEEKVAGAIFNSRIPIISAVGHETDVTIADWVADVRAPTPSAAAEIAIGEKSVLLKTLTQARTICKERVFHTLREKKERLFALKKHPLFGSPYTILSQPIQQLDGIKAALELLKPSNQIAQLQIRLKPFPDRITLAMTSVIRTKREKLKRLQEHLLSLNPKNILKKGYSVVFNAQNSSVISSISQVQSGDSLNILMHDGTLQVIKQ